MSSDDKESFIIDALRQTVSSDPGVRDSEIVGSGKPDWDGIEFDRHLPFTLPGFKNSIGGHSTSSEGRPSNGSSLDRNFSTRPSNSSSLVRNFSTHKAHLKDLYSRAIKEARKVVRPLGPTLSKSQRRKLGKKLKDQSKGYYWYDMKAAEVTEENKNDLTVLQMRKALDRKHFYKRSALNTDSNPKFFEVCTFEESPFDFYSRVPKKQRKQTLVDQIMADTELLNSLKKEFAEARRLQPPKKFQKKLKKKEKNRRNQRSAKKQKSKRNKM